ncbi:MAG: hypothetical protein AUI97_04105 [Crenarchaeota archaeon 13_1_40CM_3_52_17]|nr:MAG: hypothetical protein AUI97_04105 [Crenarchaeota archaeon 13_1_40CM_3_52_17]
MRRLDKYTLQTLGFGLTVIGLILLFISILTGGPESCPATGCVPGVFLWYDIVRDAAFFLSIAFIVLGIVMTIASRRMKPRWDTNMVAAHTPASE